MIRVALPGKVEVVRGHALELRCYSCSHGMGEAAMPMRLAVAFKPSLVPEIASLPDERRERCRSCGWVNVFVPRLDESG